jgi:hypothetical protein
MTRKAVTPYDLSSAYLWRGVRSPLHTTADDLLRLPDDGGRYELYAGMLMRETMSSGHGDTCQRLGGELGLYVRSSGEPGARAERDSPPI